ncbi:diaminopimelate epimerase [Methanocella sp. MCL-LM]|uniref:diaminopimelate epimerase n=1 Tax=Methanocella sp. MCL-LM TaxID=3412035 RepID=UPI003C724DCE
MTEIKFTKMQGNGNDFIVVDEFECPVPEDRKAAFAKKTCHRRFGVGADGVLFLAKPMHTSLHMRIFNEDGSEAEMCGNGIRCFVKYAVDHGHMKPGKDKVETKAGILEVEARVEEGKTLVKVSMGKPLFDPKKIPAAGLNNFINKPVHGYEVTAVNTGVPHAVIFVDDVKAVDLMKDAPAIRFDLKTFPKGTNVNFVQREGQHLRVRTYERGVEGETLSCGTGSVASAAVARYLGYTRDQTTVTTAGGQLNISFVSDVAYMEGPAETVYEGEIDVDFSAL